MTNAFDSMRQMLAETDEEVRKVSRRLVLRERDIEAHLVKRVKALGGEVRKVQWIGRRGAPDRLVMLGLDKAVNRLRYLLVWHANGGEVDLHAAVAELVGLTSVWPELKAPGVKPDRHQLREHERMRNMGQRVEVIDSLEGVEELLR